MWRAAYRYGNFVEKKCAHFTRAKKQTEKSPEEIVRLLNEYIIGQNDTKRSLAIALRERWRLRNVEDKELQTEITPNNILMVGPSGCGKTELARRLAQLSSAPFIKVVATKYTEVGFVGDDTQSMVHELAEQAYQNAEKQFRESVDETAHHQAVDIISEAILKGPNKDSFTRETVLQSIKEGRLDDMQVTLNASDLARESPSQPSPLESMMGVIPGPVVTAAAIPIHISGNRSFEDAFSEMMGGKHTDKKRTQNDTKVDKTVKEALPQLKESIIDKLVKESEARINEEAVTNAQESGIIFVDEFDKLVDDKIENSTSHKSKRQGVQKELLSLMEGTVVRTRFGRIPTRSILFIAAGAFSSSRPSDLMPELQGRLPIRCKLKSLDEDELVCILLHTKYNLIKQQKALLKTEGVELEFTDGAVKEIAKVAQSLNTLTADVGARRLKTVMAKLLEDLKFNAHTKSSQKIVIDIPDVIKALEPLYEQSDLSKYLI